MTIAQPAIFSAAREGDLLRFFTPARIATVFAIIGVTWVLIRYVARLLDLLARRTPRARFLVKWLEPVLRITLWFVATFLSIEILAPTQQTFFAAVGSLAIAIGLGAQDLVKNLIGGLVVLADRPYQLGDRVRIGEADGEIDHIGLRSTKLTTPEDTRVTIPNSDVLNAHIFNANSGVPDRQVVTDILLPIDTDPCLASQVGHEAAWTSPYTYLAKPVMVLVQDVFDQEPYMRLRIKAYVYDHRCEPPFQSDVTLRANSEFLRRGILQAWKRDTATCTD